MLDGYGPVGQTYAIGANLEYYYLSDFIKNNEDSTTLYSLGLMSVAAPDDSLALTDGNVKFSAGYSQGYFA